MPNHLPTLIVTPHGQPNQILYTYLHTEENRVNYLLTPSPQGDLCVAKLFPPARPGASSGSSSTSLPSTSGKHNVVCCEASRDLRWTIENTGVVSPIYKIVNQDDTPLYQISKPNPNAEFWTMFYFKYAGHQIPPKRIEFGRVAKNPQEKGGGTRITITGKSEDEKQVWQTLGHGNEDCVEWVVCCACLNLLDDQILQAAERKNTPASTAPVLPASTGPVRSSPASTSLRPNLASLARVPPMAGPRSAQPRMNGPGIASSGPQMQRAYSNDGIRPPPPGGNVRDPRNQPPPPQQNGYDPRMRPPQGQPPRTGVLQRAPPSGRRF
ncbi:hypothetical protein P7C73_g5546, partial [Tremellales sp. Uapishka_1]